MPLEAFSKRILESLTLTSNEQETIRKWRYLERIYSLLLGAGATIIHSSRLLTLKSQLGTGAYDLQQLYDDIHASTNTSRLFDWAATPQLVDWSIGLFRNKAQHNISAAYDRLLTAWLAIKIKCSITSAIEDAFTSTWPIPRLTLLQNYPHVSGCDTIINTLLRSFQTELFGTEGAAFRLRTLVDSIPPEQALTVETIYSWLPDASADCLVMVCARTNRFKHRVSSGDTYFTPEPKYSLSQHAEGAITVKALDYLCRIWHAAVLDMRSELDLVTPT